MFCLGILFFVAILFFMVAFLQWLIYRMIVFCVCCRCLAVAWIIIFSLVCNAFIVCVFIVLINGPLEIMFLAVCLMPSLLDLLFC